jgi:RNA polymerase sigma-70 factor (ECF subfamily)
MASDSAAERAAAHVKSTTAVFKRTDVKDRVRALREQLTPEERELLVLRVDRGLDWREIARVLREQSSRSSEGAPVDDDDAELARDAAALRKRFERTKARLRELAERAGMIDS